MEEYIIGLFVSECQSHFNKDARFYSTSTGKLFFFINSIEMSLLVH